MFVHINLQLIFLVFSPYNLDSYFKLLDGTEVNISDHNREIAAEINVFEGFGKSNLDFWIKADT